MTVLDFRSSFPDEAACAQYLTGQRWPEGFVCPRCGGRSRGYMASRRVHECAACGYQCSVTAGTIFHKTRVPLLDWFWAIYRMSQGKKGISALQLSKEIGVTYPTAWLMQHKIRKAMADRDQRYQLRGLLEVDEGYVGGVERGKKKQTGRGVHKSVVAVAVERRAPGEKGRKPRPGFTAMSVVEDASAASLHGFLQSQAEVGSVILTDAWRSYRGIGAKGFEHRPVRRGSDPAAAVHLFPWVHITLSNLKRFLLGTHHKVEAQHLKRYVAEFVYRLNRRGWGENLFHGLTRACLATNTIIYRDLIASPDLS
jgi:transposase-like protein